MEIKVRTNGRSEKKYEYYESYYKNRKRYFSIERYGKEKALELAQRYELTGELPEKKLKYKKVINPENGYYYRNYTNRYYDEYRIFDERKKNVICYSVKFHGKYAEMMANHTLKTKEKLKNYYEIFDNYAKLYVYSSYTRVYNEALIDIEDLDRIKEHYWYEDQSEKSILTSDYSNNLTKTTHLGKFILNLSFEDKIRYINGNRLDYRKKNLEIINKSILGKIIKKRKNNKTGTIGVSRNYKGVYIGFWVDLNGKRHTKSFSASKYGEKEAFELAKQYRLDNANKENGYLDSNI